MPPKILLEDDGTQSYLNSFWEPEKLQKHLSGKDQTFLRLFDVVISELPSHPGACMLKCKHCKGEYSCSNPTSTYKQHLSSCKKLKEQALQEERSKFPTLF